MVLLPLVLAVLPIAPPAVVPDVACETLAGSETRLASVIRGPTIVFVPTDRAHQREVDTWMPVADELARAEVTYRQLSLFAPDVPGFVIGIVKIAMRARLDHTHEQAVLIARSEHGPFFAALGEPATGGVLVVLIDQDRRVLWRSRGTMNKAAADALRAAVRAHATPPGG